MIPVLNVEADFVWRRDSNEMDLNSNSNLLLNIKRDNQTNSWFFETAGWRNVEIGIENSNEMKQISNAYIFRNIKWAFNIFKKIQANKQLILF